MFSEKEIQFSKDWIKAIYDLKKSLDNWAFNNLQDLWDNKFQSSFMQFLLLIESEGNTNGELAKMSGISKQAMSKIILQLAEMDLIKNISSLQDKRSSKVLLTSKGEYVISESLKRFTLLISQYQEQIQSQDIEVSKHTLDLVKIFIQNYKK
jgi:DNA-binding MarR family transcriptional regulator